jgi:hypothetical protein
LADRLDHREAGAHRPLGIIPRATEILVAELEVTKRPETIVLDVEQPVPMVERLLAPDRDVGWTCGSGISEIWSYLPVTDLAATARSRRCGGGSGELLS